MLTRPSLPEFAADSRTTSLRASRLQAYFEEHILAGDRFICSDHRQCRDSHSGTFYAGQLPHVGHYYDLTRNRRPFRIVVVGQEYGHGPENVGLLARRTMILDGSGTACRFRAADGYPARNPHMKGCTSVLRLLFGKDLGSDHEDEFVDLNGNMAHLFDCFALVNFLLCSAVPAEPIRPMSESLAGKRGQSTRTMQHNCAPHFKATLELLEPTIIVLQGRGVLGWMGQAFDTLSDDLVQTIQINGKAVRVLGFTHPSTPRRIFNWGLNDRMPYLVDVVAPTVRRVLVEEDDPTAL